MTDSKQLAESLASVLKNVDCIRRIAFDIGQTVVKIAYTSAKPKRTTNDQKQLINNKKCVLRLHCVQVRLDDFEAVLDYIAENGHIVAKKATFASTSTTAQIQVIISQKLGLELYGINQMDCLVSGTNFLIRNIEAESFTYHHHNDSCKYSFETFRPSSICPYLLVNVGTGVSVFRVDNDEKYERVGGSSLGGGSFFGLAQLLTDMELSLDELLKMAEDGDHRQIDILVSDIYGQGYIGLEGDIIAGSFGKCTNRRKADLIQSSPEYKKNVVRSLLLMISNSIGQFAFLYAQKEKVRRIYFDGFLIRNRPIIMRTIAYSINFWSEGAQQAHFLRHEGYTSAIGAFLKGGKLPHSHSDEDNYGVGNEAARYSWHEYYTGCSELGRFVPTAPLSAGFTAGVLELECTDIVLRPFPLLAEDIKDYKPDVVDLSLDAHDREFWLETMRCSVDKVMSKALESQAESLSAATRAHIFKEKFLGQLQIISEKSFAYGSCTVRNLLDLREQLLNEQEFDDSFLTQKSLENQSALLDLRNVLTSIDEIMDSRNRLLLVCKGLLAGNVFDWGAKKVIELMESSEGLSFGRAIATIPDRPWLVDAFDEFADSFSSKPYKCAAIFVDNSGVDFVLGVIPFARELMRSGTKVLIISNLHPALNDLTYREMMDLVPQLKESDDFLRECIDTDQLMFHHSGQGSPCLDLRKVHSVLNKAVIQNEVDFVVIEGMGRALHTNFNANFKCDSLKAAVIKSEWLADKMGGHLFSIVFKFQSGKNFANMADLP